METVELPYKAEYAKTGRAGCKGCKMKIPQGSLRIAAMVQSAFHDSKQPNWFHENCFFRKQRPLSIGDIENFENLRFEDQQRVEKQIDEVAAVVPSTGGGKKRSKSESSALKDFSIEYAKSGRAACCGCQQKILKDEVRIRKTVYDTEVGMKYGGQALWHHVECFAQMRSELGWFDTGESLPGYKSLKVDDKAQVTKALPAIKAEDAGPSAKKLKTEVKTSEEEALDKELAEKVKQQTKQMFFFRDLVKDSLSKADINKLLQRNEQDPVTGDSEKLLDQVADLLAFGAIAACTVCKGRQMLFQKSGYLCNGQLTEWTKCTNIVKEPNRVACKVPSDLKKEYRFLSKVGKKPETRVIRYIPPSAATIAKSVNVKKHDDEVDGPKVKRARPPLYNFNFCYIGLKDEVQQLKRRVALLGGKCDSKLTQTTVAIFATAKDLEGKSVRMTRAKEMGIQIIPIEYLDAVEKDPPSALNFIRTMSLCDWGTDPAVRIPQDEQKSAKSKSIYTKSVPKSVTLKIKDGVAVDPDSGLGDVAQVYVKGNDKYSVVLGITDIQRNKNSFYKIQLLTTASQNRFWVFRSWGRIGTTIGGNKLEKFPVIFEALQSFEQIYLDKTGNRFELRDQFVKVPGRMYPIDIDYDDRDAPKLDESKVKSKLQPAVQDLIRLLFDVETMKKTMMLFDLDMDKMPLGKLTQKQIMSAYTVLTELANAVQTEGSSNSRFIDATNRFYTLIPHNFGVCAPPLINTVEQIEKLREMLDSLLEIECAYNLIQTDMSDSDVNPLDRHYEQLKTKLEPLDKEGEEFKLMQQYVQNTHADTHKMYELEIQDVFKVERQGEARRYKPFKKLHNRKLLWHGSRLTNFAGILSHGLKIAPPEAPVTGYMFGKGIYFADMVSKSANYCCTSNSNSTGLLLLSEVALGDMLECTAAKSISKLPADKHSCYGRGRTMPDPQKAHVRGDGVQIPLGTPITDEKMKTSLLYNEYIVYDIAQVNIQYMLRLNFKYKF